METSAQSSSHPVNIKRPRIECFGFEGDRSRGREKHLTSLDLEKLVVTIKEKRDFPSPPTEAKAATLAPQVVKTLARPSSPAQGSSETISTADVGSTESERAGSQGCGSETSVNSDMSQHSVVRGFTPGIKSSYRSQTRLAPQIVPQPTIVIQKSEEPKKKGNGFLIGGSSEEESSIDSNMSKQLKPRPSPGRSSLSDNLRRPLNKKQTSFKDVVTTRTINPTTPAAAAAAASAAVFESDDDDLDDESAIEDDDDSSDWEDSATDSGHSSVLDTRPLFQRVDSRPQLTSRRSLLTSLMHQSDRQSAMEKAAIASQSTPALMKHRSRTSSPNGPSVAASPEDEGSTLTMRGPQIPRSKPIIMTTSNTHQPALSPRTTRRNMLASELSESLRKHLINERQQKNATAAAVLKRRHTAHDMGALKEYPSTTGDSESRNNSWHNELDDAVGGYHQKGW